MRIMQLLRRAQQLQQGDFSQTATDYAQFQPPYSDTVRRALLGYVDVTADNFLAADVGAGTGIWSRQLLDAGVRCVCVEPDAQMRKQGAAATNAEWVAGSAENTTLPPASVNWVTVAAAFHWMDHVAALDEFARILKPNGYLTLLRHPLSEFQTPLVESVAQAVDQFLQHGGQRRGGRRHQAGFDALRESPAFGDPLYMEAGHTHWIDSAAYISVVAQLPNSAELVAHLQTLLQNTAQLPIAYTTRTWTFPNLS